jgi:hypothetical protein
VAPAETSLRTTQVSGTVRIIVHVHQSTSPSICGQFKRE